MRDALVPSMPHTRDEWSMLVAILGTTISPYLFFWQASEEVEKKKRPVSIRFLNGEEQRPSNFG
jgi:Mn2+/Fe2+ NRAMP family transporter